MHDENKRSKHAVHWMSKNLLKLNHDQTDFQGSDDLNFWVSFILFLFHPPGFFRQVAAHTRKLEDER